MIRHLRHGDIDKAAWDAMLLHCANRLWYAQSWVLDHMSPGWEALVDEDAGAIMPLTHRRKAGLAYLFQPYGLQQLGVFSERPSPDSHAAFIRAAAARFRYIDICLNEGMERFEARGVTCEPWPNQVLVANAPLAALCEGYAKGHRRNLRRGGAGLRAGSMDAAGFVRLFQATTGARFGVSAVKGLDQFGAVIAEGLQRGECRIDALHLDGEPIAAACFSEWQGRSIWLKSANTAKGMEHRAMFRIASAWIERHAGSGMVLDFAGSATASVARFNAGFGAREETYFRLRWNRLPLPLRWIKP